jgi:hypothetical protein
MDKSDNAYKTIGEVAKILNLINSKTGSLSTHTINQKFLMAIEDIMIKKILIHLKKLNFF